MAQLKSTTVTGNLAVTGKVLASAIIKMGGTRDEILCADGSTTTLSGLGAGTVTSVTVQGSSGLTGSGTVTSAGTITLSHGNTSDATNLTANGRTYVTGLTFDDYGHVTGYTTGTETVTAPDVSGFLKTNGTNTMNATLQFNAAHPIYWSGGSYHQRIYVTDDDSKNTAVFTFQQTENSGTSWNDLFTIQDRGSVIMKNPEGTAMSLVFDRTNNANWRLLSDNGDFIAQCDYTSKKDSYYDVLRLKYNSKNAVFSNTVESKGFIGTFTPATNLTKADYVVMADGTFKTTSDLGASISDLYIPKVPCTDHAVPRFDGSTSTLQDSMVLIDDSDNVTIGTLYSGTTANNPYLSFGGEAKISANSAGALALGPDNKYVYLAEVASFRMFADYKGSSTLGKAGYAWKSLYLTNDIIKETYNSSGTTTATYTYTLPDETGTLATQEWVNQQALSGEVDLSNYVTLNTQQTISGKKLFTSNNSAGSTTISSELDAIKLVPYSRTGTVGEYYPGIAFNNLEIWSNNTYVGGAQAWMGTRLVDTSGSERVDLVFATKEDNASGPKRPVERMCVRYNGNVGIGTKTPSSNLTVVGTIETTDGTNSGIIQAPSSGYGSIAVTGAKGGYSGINLGNTGNNITVMDNGAHAGIYTERTGHGGWIFGYQYSDKTIGIAGYTRLSAGYRVNVHDSMEVKNTLRAAALNVGGQATFQYNSSTDCVELVW